MLGVWLCISLSFILVFQEFIVFLYIVLLLISSFISQWSNTIGEIILVLLGLCALYLLDEIF